MSLEFNAENRNANIVNNNIVRCCSFCRRAGHTITSCNSIPIIIFERSCLNFIRFNIYDGVTEFRNFLLEEVLQNSNVVRAFAIRRCGARVGSNIDTYIELNIQYFTPHIENTQSRTRMNEAMMFLDMMSRVRELIEVQDKKFNIKTKISENQYDLEEKCECNICYEEHERKNFVKLDCCHEFCKDCTKKSLQNERRNIPCCAFCRSEIKIVELKLESIKQEFDDLIITSEIV
jgi:hypothetical protein